MSSSGGVAPFPSIPCRGLRSGSMLQRLRISASANDLGFRTYGSGFRQMHGPWVL